MCYNNKMGKLCDVTLCVGDLAESLKGHDTGRMYVVVAELSGDFVLVADGKYRLTSNPKLKIRKHLKYICKTQASDDESIAKQISKVEDQNAKRR